MKGPFLSLYMNHAYITYNAWLYSSENEYSEVCVLYFVYLYFEISDISSHLKKCEGKKH